MYVFAVWYTIQTNWLTKVDLWILSIFGLANCFQNVITWTVYGICFNFAVFWSKIWFLRYVIALSCPYWDNTTVLAKRCFIIKIIPVHSRVSNCCREHNFVSYAPILFGTWTNEYEADLEKYVLCTGLKCFSNFSLLHIFNDDDIVTFYQTRQY